MKKGKLLLASVGIIGLFLLVPFAHAASSQVWFNQSTELVWFYTEELLDASMQPIDLNSSYRKLNFTEVLAGPDHLNISGKLHSATTADVTTYGFTDPTIWVQESMSMSPEIYDNDLKTKFASFFNELNTNLTDIQTLTVEEQTLIGMAMVMMLDPSALATIFVYILVKAFGGSFALDYNSSTINQVSDRVIDYDLDIMYGNEDEHGVWNNITFHSNNELTYGNTSNVLVKSVCTSAMTGSEGNSSGVVEDTIRGRFTHEIRYPESLMDDYPEPLPDPDPDPDPDPNIPGFPIYGLVGAMVLGIVPAYLVIKRKKK